MATTDALLKEGINLIRAGRKAEARPILERVVDQDDQSAEAWLWLSACVETVEDQQVCLENVLSLDPNNEKARKGLDAISKLAKPRAKPAAPSPTPFEMPPASADPFGGGFGNFGSAAPTPEPTNSSVDWGKGSVPALGSGKNVQLPSAEEYDMWMASLPIGGGGSGGSSGFSAPSAPVSAPDPAPSTSAFGSFDDFSFTPSPPKPASPPAFSGSDPFGSAFSAPSAPSSSGSSFDFGASAPAFNPSGATDPFGSSGGGLFDGPFAATSTPDGGDPFDSFSANFDAGFGKPSAPKVTTPPPAPPPAPSAGKSLFDEPFDFAAFSGGSSSSSAPASAPTNYAQDPYSQNDYGTGDYDQQLPTGYDNAPDEPNRGSSSRIRFDALPDTFGTVEDEYSSSRNLDRRGANELLGGSGLFPDDGFEDLVPVRPSSAAAKSAPSASTGSTSPSAAMSPMSPMEEGESGVFGASASTSRKGSSTTTAAGFRAIPSEIQVKTGGGGNPIVTVLLLLLNVASIVFLLINAGVLKIGQ